MDMTRVFIYLKQIKVEFLPTCDIVIESIWVSLTTRSITKRRKEMILRSELKKRNGTLLFKSEKLVTTSKRVLSNKTLRSQLLNRSKTPTLSLN